MTETRFYEPVRLSSPPKPLFSLKPQDPTTWLRSLLSKVFHFLLVKRVKCSAILYSLPKQHNLVPRSSRLTVQFSGIRPLPSSKNPHFQNEARCTTFLVKMSFICMRMKNDFHIKGWTPTLVLKQRPGGTWKWPIMLHNWRHFSHISKFFQIWSTVADYDELCVGF